MPRFRAKVRGAMHTHGDVARGKRREAQSRQRRAHPLFRRNLTFPTDPQAACDAWHKVGQEEALRTSGAREMAALPLRGESQPACRFEVLSQRAHILYDPGVLPGTVFPRW
ncbi:hypothetical protein H920_12000 [Fukomys damarensis]|uniref:Uncharacterized protein n=1 Tax=Fukomys damarensis TaxID=885580 RepID=A0A091DUZ1_FUKDA|nr:hypothetical protein H920_12000 [Fukomys damarensis]